MKFNSKEYWENRYRNNRSSGSGSYGLLCDFKATVINDFIFKNDIKSVVEFGCGDGNQLSHFICNRYFGYDVSETIIKNNIIKFKHDKTKSFNLYDYYKPLKYNLSLSLDVIFHLVEDNVFDLYMNRLFNSSDKFVIIYSSNGDVLKSISEHVYDRNFTNWILKNRNDFQLIEKVTNKYKYDKNNPDNTSISDFYMYIKKT